MAEIKTIETSEAPEAIGPYSQAVATDTMIFLSGQIPLDPKTQEMVSGGIAEQAEQVFKNLEAVLKEAGSGFDKVLKATCYMKDLSQFAEFNEIYGKYLGGTKPARATFEVAGLPKAALVEVDLIALR